MLNLFAHVGHVHDEPVSFFETSEGFIIINVAPFLLLALVLLLLYRLKVKRSALLMLTLATLLTIGLIGYRYVPIASIISLVAGFGLSLAWVIMPFKKKR